MNVEKMIKRDISVEIANYLTNNLTCYEKKNIDDEKTYETNFLHLMNVIGKNVINIPVSYTHLKLSDAINVLIDEYIFI